MNCDTKQFSTMSGDLHINEMISSAISWHIALSLSFFPLPMNHAVEALSCSDDEDQFKKEHKHIKQMIIAAKLLSYRKRQSTVRMWSHIIRGEIHCVQVVVLQDDLR